ncbi:CHAT domain-containing protein [Ephemerocybe angulata]|uniref:CHAT domain-containing protein n=1 Tax=Ephemerocybe angulata TaxID=980116 RepID=A0A8H6HX20_9AGAR|nr:CHAT domain-containing protein [Tulosesus angulatus]
MSLRTDGRPSDISGAISAYQKSVNLSPRGDKELPSRLANVGSSFHRYFERTGDLSHIEEAIEAKRKAVKLIPQGSPDQYAILSNLGNSLRFRFGRAGELTDINEAIALQREARDLTPQGHANYPIMLNNLGLSLRCRFDRTGDLSDISEAIAGQQKAVGVTQPKHTEHPTFLNDLGVSLNCRFERTGELADISEAISVQQKAVDITAENHADLPSRLTNLGRSLSRRFERTGELPDIAEAISVQKRGIELTPTDHASLIVMFNDLGNSYTFSFERTRNISDINESIKAYKKVVDLTPEGHPDVPSQFANLGRSLSRRSEQTKDISGVSEAISVQQRALKLSPPGYSATPGIHSNLAFSFRRRFSWGKTDTDLGEAIFHYQAAATSPSGSPQVKLTAATAWARLLRRYYPHSPKTLHAFDVAIGLITLIAGLEQTVRSRYTQLQSTSGLALEAAAAAFTADRADKALEWLEQGRCHVWNQLNNLRTPLEDLQIRNGPLAQIIREVSKQLETAGSSRGQRDINMRISEKVTVEDEAHAHLKLAKRWNDLLGEARAIPGFDNFLKPIPCATLLENLPESGPVVVINLDEGRCDAIALLVGVGEPFHIHLPNFSVETASMYRADLNSQLESWHLRVREEEKSDGGRGIRSASIGGSGQIDLPVHRVLRGLWECVVKPILDALGISKAKNTPGEVLPRIWWCPTGPLSFLPLHAAGIYSHPNDAESTLDYVVSSYTPTVTAIIDRVKNCPAIDTKASGLFLTSQPSAPGASSIHGTTREVRTIFTKAKEHGVRALRLEGDEMSVDRCLESMLDFSSIHLACHGSQNAAEPLQSRFIFHRGSLQLGTILKSDLKNADLAFLSACQTSTGDEKISDEAVHLAAGMLAAGYRRVVATMWSIGDQPAQEVATDFYDFILAHRKGDSGATFDATLSAHALHHATQQLRHRLDNSEHSLLAWVPFVHFGY